MRLWPRRRKRRETGSRVTSDEVNTEGHIIGETTYLMDYREHYGSSFDETGTPLSNRILAELFLYRAWTAQFAYRMAADQRAHDALISETVNACHHLGLGIFKLKHGVSVEEELGNDFISLIEDRWGTYDGVVTEYFGSQQADDDKLPFAELAGAFTNLARVTDPLVLYAVAMDTGNHVHEIAENSMQNDLFKPGRPVG